MTLPLSTSPPTPTGLHYAQSLTTPTQSKTPALQSTGTKLRQPTRLAGSTLSCLLLSLRRLILFFRLLLLSSMRMEDSLLSMLIFCPGSSSRLQMGVYSHLQIQHLQRIRLHQDLQLPLLLFYLHLPWILYLRPIKIIPML